ncbi:hypothetical protein AD947_03845 [Acetobacter tropicalis]|uniref:Uncharacterized protein n=2 Tax=Acetobacter TaxID=434 RepID=A0A149V752_9PROT|nr:hypothetical protein AD947_03845 [Acetobacter tropicalis]KXV75753.1 hypothetical protein AD953_06330 [Acetobacter malorum]
MTTERDNPRSPQPSRRSALSSRCTAKNKPIARAGSLPKLPATDLPSFPLTPLRSSPVLLEALSYQRPSSDAMIDA